MVSVVDTINDKVIRQIPEEEVLDLVAKMKDYIGLIFDKKA
jgi:flagellar protein FlaG